MLWSWPIGHSAWPFGYGTGAWRRAWDIPDHP